MAQNIIIYSYDELRLRTRRGKLSDNYRYTYYLLVCRGIAGIL